MTLLFPYFGSGKCGSDIWYGYQKVTAAKYSFRVRLHEKILCLYCLRRLFSLLLSVFLLRIQLLKQCSYVIIVTNILKSVNGSYYNILRVLRLNVGPYWATFCTISLYEKYSRSVESNAPYIYKLKYFNDAWMRFVEENFTWLWEKICTLCFFLQRL